MRKALSTPLLAATLPVLVLSILAADGKRPPTDQIQRGLNLFTNSPKGTACATCHQMAGYGTAVGPDLTTMGSMGTPHVIVSTVRMSMTTYVQSVKIDNRTFPAMVKEQGKYETEVWDLSQVPPVPRKLPNTEIKAIERDQNWKHPPASVDYTPQEFADLIGFLRWAATGATKEVKASEVADLQ
jgi:Cytochrome c